MQGTFAQADRDASRGVAFAQICTFDRRRAPMDGWAVRGCRFDTASGRHASSLMPECAAHCFAAVTARRVAARAALSEWTRHAISLLPTCAARCFAAVTACVAAHAALSEWTVGQLVPLPWHGLSAARRLVANACVARCSLLRRHDAWLLAASAWHVASSLPSRASLIASLLRRHVVWVMTPLRRMDGWAARGCRFGTASARYAVSSLPTCVAHRFAAVTARRVAAHAALTEWTVGQLVPLPWHGLSAARRFVANACVARCFAGAALSGGSFARGRAVQRCVVFKQPRSLQLFVEGHRPHKADSGA